MLESWIKIGIAEDGRHIAKINLKFCKILSQNKVKNFHVVAQLLN